VQAQLGIIPGHGIIDISEIAHQAPARYAYVPRGRRIDFKNSKGGTIMKNVGIATVSLVLLTGAPVFAAPSNDLPDQPQAQIADGIQYLSGGFGVDERQTLQQEAKGDNLELSFALLNKRYLGGANLIIKDSKGTNVFEGASEGPLFYAKLPEGKYTVAATAEGKTLTQVVHVPAKGQARVFFAWPSADESSNYDTASN